MLTKILKTRTIKEFELEILEIEKRGHISCFTEIKKSKFPGALPSVVGVEIIFNDHVTDDQIDRIKVYVEEKYKMLVDTKSFTEKGKLPKIIYVEY